jgi:hypothetical protein
MPPEIPLDSNSSISSVLTVGAMSCQTVRILGPDCPAVLNVINSAQHLSIKKHFLYVLFIFPFLVNIRRSPACGRQVCSRLLYRCQAPKMSRIE